MRVGNLLTGLSLIFHLSGCGGPTGASLATTACALSTDCRSATVGIGGGHVSNRAASLEIPPAAFSAPTNVAIASENLATGFEILPGAISVGPLVYAEAAAVPAAPVTVSLSFDPGRVSGLCTTRATLATAADISVLTSKTGVAGTWTRLDATPSDVTVVSLQTSALQYFLPVVTIYESDPREQGFAPGQVIPNLALKGPAVLNLGSPATADSKDPAAWQQNLSFEWLHNQACNGYRYAYLDVTAAWCWVSASEADALASSEVASWLPHGGLVVSILEQGHQPSGVELIVGPTPPHGENLPAASAGAATPATPDELGSWIAAHGVNYTIAVDEALELQASSRLDAWPAIYFIRLSDMRVMSNQLGNINDAFTSFDTLLATCDLSVGTGCPNGQACDDNGLCK